MKSSLRVKAQQSSSCYNSALRMLTRREHSLFELEQKLTQKDFEQQQIDQALARLVEQGYQSDERFAEAFIRLRHNQGKGPVKITAELKQRGVTHFDLSVFDFFELAKTVRLKKFGDTVPNNYQEKAKQQRFLQSRGFSFEQINHAIDS